jgi:hypothetical protein
MRFLAVGSASVPGCVSAGDLSVASLFPILKIEIRRPIRRTAIRKWIVNGWVERGEDTRMFGHVTTQAKRGLVAGAQNQIVTCSVRKTVTMPLFRRRPPWQGEPRMGHQPHCINLA